MRLPVGRVASLRREGGCLADPPYVAQPVPRPSPRAPGRGVHPAQRRGHRLPAPHIGVAPLPAPGRRRRMGGREQGVENDRLENDRLTRTTGSWPRSVKAVTMCEPMEPAPPVSLRCASGDQHAHGGDARPGRAAGPASTPCRHRPVRPVGKTCRRRRGHTTVTRGTARRCLPLRPWRPFASPGTPDMSRRTRPADASGLARPGRTPAPDPRPGRTPAPDPRPGRTPPPDTRLAGGTCAGRASGRAVCRTRPSRPPPPTNREPHDGHHRPRRPSVPAASTTSRGGSPASTKCCSTAF